MYRAIVLPLPPESFKDVPSNKALVCVVNNGPFEAAALCYSEQEFLAFLTPDEIDPSTVEKLGDMIFTLKTPYQEAGQQRPRTWLLLEKGLALELAGYYE